MKFKKIELSDEKKIERLSLLASEIVKEYYDPILGSEQNDYMIEKFQSVDGIKRQLTDGYGYYICENDNNDVGFTAFYKRDDEIYLSKLYLKKTERGKGFSKEILDFVKENAKNCGVNKITLNVNKYNKSIDFYVKMGFKKIRAEKNDIGHGYFMDDYVMTYNF